MENVIISDSGSITGSSSLWAGMKLSPVIYLLTRHELICQGWVDLDEYIQSVFNFVWYFLGWVLTAWVSVTIFTKAQHIPGVNVLSISSIKFFSDDFNSSGITPSWFFCKRLTNLIRSSSTVQEGGRCVWSGGGVEDGIG